MLLQIMTECEDCTNERKMYLLRNIMYYMGNSEAHDYLFFKFQPEMTAHMGLILEVRAMKMLVGFGIHLRVGRRFRRRRGCMWFDILMS